MSIKTDQDIANILDPFERNCGLDDILEEAKYYQEFNCFRPGRHRDDVPDWFKRVERYLGPRSSPEAILLHVYRYIAIKSMEAFEELQRKVDDAADEAREEYPE